jgi:hypothetical protein
VGGVASLDGAPLGIAGWHGPEVASSPSGDLRIDPRPYRDSALTALIGRLHRRDDTAWLADVLKNIEADSHDRTKLWLVDAREVSRLIDPVGSECR